MTVYTNSNIAIFMNTPPEMAGVVGGIFNAALQLGVGLGVAIVASISTSIEQKRAAQGIATPEDYHGAAAAYWFIVAWLVLLAVLILLFYRVEPQWRTKGEDVEEQSGAGAEMSQTASTISNEKEKEREDRKIERDLESADPVIALPEAGLATAAIVEMSHHHQG